MATRLTKNTVAEVLAQRASKDARPRSRREKDLVCGNTRAVDPSRRAFRAPQDDGLQFRVAADNSPADEKRCEAIHTASYRSGLLRR